MGRLRLFGSRIRAPSILGSVMRTTEINSANRMRQPSFRGLADLLIEPPSATFILAFDRYALDHRHRLQRGEGADQGLASSDIATGTDKPFVAGLGCGASGLQRCVWISSARGRWDVLT
jgi:hypothetical protein